MTQSIANTFSDPRSRYPRPEFETQQQSIPGQEKIVKPTPKPFFTSPASC